MSKLLNQKIKVRIKLFKPKNIQKGILRVKPAGKNKFADIHVF